MLTNEASCLDSIHFRHPNIHQNHIRRLGHSMEHFEMLNRLLPVACFPDNLEIRLNFQRSSGRGLPSQPLRFDGRGMRSQGLKLGSTRLIFNILAEMIYGYTAATSNKVRATPEYRFFIETRKVVRKVPAN